MSNSAWNAEYNSAKGSLLVGNGTRPIVRTVGTDGQVLTANSANADGVEWAAGGAGSIVNLSPYIVGATQSDFTTISAAIAQAVIDGVTATNQINIYIKPGTYVENITLAPGINLDGFLAAGSFEPTATSQMPVKIQGTCSFFNGPNRIQNLQFIPIGSTPFLFSSLVAPVRYFLNNIFYIETAAPATIFSLIAGVSNNVDIKDSLIISTTSPLISASFGNLLISNSVVRTNAVSTVASGTVAILAKYSEVRVSVDLGAAVTLGDLQFNFCVLSTAAAATPILTSVTNARILTVRHCTVSNSGNITSVASLQAVNSLFATYQTATDASSFTNCSCLSDANVTGTTVEVFRGITAVNQELNYIRGQRYLSTATAVTSTLASILLNQEEAICLKGQIIGSNDAHTDTVGGTFLIVARRTTAGNITQVGTTTVDVKSDTTATFTADVDIGTQSVRIRVTGLAATIYQWVCVFEYEKMIL